MSMGGDYYAVPLAHLAKFLDGNMDFEACRSDELEESSWTASGAFAPLTPSLSTGCPATAPTRITAMLGALKAWSDRPR
jgi:hypothetical protein